MNKDKIDKYNDHAKLMAEIAINVLSGNTKIIEENKWFKELIAFYLLIPYITNNILSKPDDNCKISHVSETFIKTDDGWEISLENLRHAISHSFLTIEWDQNDWNNFITIDDRATYKSPGEHDKQNRWKNYRMPVKYCHDRLLEIFANILKQ